MERQDIRTHGDPLEREYADLICSRFPAYAEIWGEYIGNDGASHPLPISWMTEGDEKRRSHSSQHMYTSLQSIVCMTRLLDDVRSIDLAELGQPSRVDQYLEITNLLLAFMAHAGRLRDQVKELCAQWGAGNLHMQFQEWYKQRCVVLHGVKIPIGDINGDVHIAVPRGESQTDSGWCDKMLWENADSVEVDELDAMLEGTLDGSIESLQRVLAGLYSDHIRPLLDDNKGGIEAPVGGVDTSLTASGES